MKANRFAFFSALLITVQLMTACVGSSDASGSSAVSSNPGGSSIIASDTPSETAPVGSSTSSSDTLGETGPGGNVSGGTDYPSSFMVNQENSFDYQPGLECAAFSSAYVLRHYGQEARGLELFENFPGKLADGNGVFPHGITTFFQAKGFQAEFVVNATIDELKRQLAKGAPVIVFIHVEEPYESTHNTHYIPAVGYDEEYLYFAESLEQYANCKDEEGLPYNRRTEIDKFMRLWKNIDGYYDYPYFKISPSMEDSPSVGGNTSTNGTPSADEAKDLLESE